MTNLKQLANLMEEMDKEELNTPSLQCAQAMLDSLMQHGVSYNDATRIAYSMDINVTSFDITNPDWARVIAAYTSVLRKFRDIAGIDAVLIKASKMSLHFAD